MKKRLLTIIIIAILSILGLKAENTKYYSSYKINETDYSFMPANPIPSEQAKDSVCNRFIYDEAGNVKRIEGVGYGMSFNDSNFKVYKIVISQKKHLKKILFYDQEDNPMKSNTCNSFGLQVEYYKNTYNLYYLNSKGEKKLNPEGIFFKKVEKNENNIITESYFNQNKIQVSNQLDVFKTEKIYKKEGFVKEIRSYNIDNKLVNNILGYAIKRIKYSHNTNVSEETYFDDKKAPAKVLPYHYSKKIKKDGNKPTFYDISGKRIYLKRQSSNIEEIDINYNIIIELTTEDLINNLFFVEGNREAIWQDKVNITQKELSKKIKHFCKKTHQKLDSLLELNQIKDKNTFYSFGSYMPINKELVNELYSINKNKYDEKLTEILFGTNEFGEANLNKYFGLLSRMCYGPIKEDEVFFFRWKNNLFCVNPFHIGNPNYSSRKLLTIDFAKIPIDARIKNVIFSGLTVKNFHPSTYFSDINFYFQQCNINTNYSDQKKFKKPTISKNNELASEYKLTFTFNNSFLDTCNIYCGTGYSTMPYRFFPSYIFKFSECEFNYFKMGNYAYTRDGIYERPEISVIFNKSNINNLEIKNGYSSLIFRNSKIKDFYAVDVNMIYKELRILNTSFESPINFPGLQLSDSAYFEMQNSSYEAYMKFPWEIIKGKIKMNVEDNALKSYRNLYNLLSLNYKTLALIEDADDSYFYWKQFERENFWRMYWAEENTHWYNPFHVARAVGYTVFNYINYYSCGYGIKPLWILPFTFFIVFLFALIFFLMPTSISSIEEHLLSHDKISKRLEKKNQKEIKEIFREYDFDFKQNKQGLIEDIVSSLSSEELMNTLELKPKSKFNLSFFWYCIYFSFSTFTTIGIGDWYPSGKWNKAMVMIEGAIGWLCLGLFITTYANILLR